MSTSGKKLLFSSPLSVNKMGDSSLLSIHKSLNMVI
jgi:hypothetical protein